MMTCELCNDTGFYGDNGPGIRGNEEWQYCECVHGIVQQIVKEISGVEGHGKIICLISDYADAKIKSAISSANQWVSCAERLPDEEDYFLTWNKDYRTPIILPYYPNAERFLNALGQQVFVTHWQPLPMPPGKELVMPEIPNRIRELAEVSKC